jgi:hypothetical protein
MLIAYMTRHCKIIGSQGNSLGQHLDLSVWSSEARLGSPPPFPAESEMGEGASSYVLVPHNDEDWKIIGEWIPFVLSLSKDMSWRFDKLRTNGGITFPNVILNLHNCGVDSTKRMRNLGLSAKIVHNPEGCSVQRSILCSPERCPLKALCSIVKGKCSLTATHQARIVLWLSVL